MWPVQVVHVPMVHVMVAEGRGWNFQGCYSVCCRCLQNATFHVAGGHHWCCTQCSQMLAISRSHDVLSYSIFTKQPWTAETDVLPLSSIQGNAVMHMELWGNHVWFRPTGELYVKFDDGDEYCWSTVRGATVGSRNPVPTSLGF